MGYAIFIEECGHFRRDHILIVRNCNEGDFLARLRFSLSDRSRIFLGVWLWCGAHNDSVYTKLRS